MLHYRNQTAHVHRHNLQRELSELHPQYNNREAKLICPIELKDNYEIAKSRALSLEREHERVNTPKANPYTNVYELLDKIVENGKAG